MRNPGGYLIGTSPDSVDEHDTFTCAHCNKIVIVKHKSRPEDMGGLCKICMGLTCPQCTGHSCRPFEEQLKKWEASDAARRSYGI